MRSETPADAHHNTHVHADRERRGRATVPSPGDEHYAGAPKLDRQKWGYDIGRHGDLKVVAPDGKTEKKFWVLSEVVAYQRRIQFLEEEVSQTNELQQQVVELEEESKTRGDRVSALEASLVTSSDGMRAKERECAAQAQELEDLRKRIRAHASVDAASHEISLRLQEATQENKELKSALQQATAAVASASDAAATTSLSAAADSSHMQGKVKGMEDTIAEQKAKIMSLEQALEASAASNRQCNDTIQEQSEEIAQQMKDITNGMATGGALRMANEGSGDISEAPRRGVSVRLNLRENAVSVALDIQDGQGNSSTLMPAAKRAKLVL